MGLLRFIKESIKEGYDEAKAEHEQGAATYQELKAAPITLEKKALALACPMREVLLSSDMGGFSPHLYKLGMLDSKQKKEARDLLARDFDIYGKEEIEHNQLIQARQKLFAEWEKDDQEVDTATLLTLANVHLYILTTAIDADYITFDQVQTDISTLVDTLTQKLHVDSWQTYAALFKQGEEQLAINNRLGRKLIHSRIRWLLEDEESPWVNLNWADQ
ncbi:hypothetical protein NRIC_28470 [Enterococcus florum]|uniref:Uncharacterized protein n=1 Tax=Enterococcus florum TaxID=2480627 RepID=A0A4P5PB81_9ENTE|nr:DUF1266 domain-containing protein [Enterococcus florum]GCF94956.1 hypothetical protein NRIC_28470 [Enterococcus florum]